MIPFKIKLKLPWYKRILPVNRKKQKIMQKLLDYTYKKHKDTFNEEIRNYLLTYWE